MRNPAAELVSELLADIRSPKLLAALSAGLIAGLGLLVAEIAFGGFIFSGHLAPYFSQGVGLILFGNFASCLLIALLSRYRGVISGLPAAPMAVMVLIGAGVETESSRLFITTVAALVISAVAAGVLCLLIARFRLAEVMRFIPFPVAAGVVAGTGGVVLLAAMALMGAALDRKALAALLEPSSLGVWGPGVGFGLLLYVVMKRWRNSLVLPIAVLVAGVLFHIGLSVLNVSSEAARAAGLLFDSAAEGSLWPAFQVSDLALVDWMAVAEQIPGMFTLVLVALIYLVMNLAALELAANQDLDWNHEFRSAGAASVVAGLGGGTVGCAIVPPSLRSKMLGATSRLTGIVAALVLGVALFAGDAILQLVPVPLVGGILFFTGLGMIEEGIWKSRARMTWAEYAVVLVMFVAIIMLGFLEGVGAGLLATLVFFALHLSRVDPVSARFNLARGRSSKARTVPEQAILDAERDQLLCFRLRGYIFFGSAVPLASTLRQAIEGKSKPACILLEFDGVSGFDSSAVSVLCKFFRAAQEADVQVVLSAAGDRFRSSVQRSLSSAAYSSLLFEQDEDRALQCCEDIIIATRTVDTSRKAEMRSWLLRRSAAGMERYFDRQIAFESILEKLEPWLTVRMHSAGEDIAASREAPEGLWFLQSGLVSAYDEGGARICQLGPGDSLSNIHHAQAGIVCTLLADESCRTVELAPDVLSWLEHHEADRALQVYRYLVYPWHGNSSVHREAP